MSENSQEGRGPYPAEGRERAVRMVLDPDDRSKSSRHTHAPLVLTALVRRRPAGGGAPAPPTKESGM